MKERERKEDQFPSGFELDNRKNINNLLIFINKKINLVSQSSYLKKLYEIFCNHR